MRYPVLGRSQVVDSKRRDVRVVEGARLESVCRGNSTVGSNPTLSANSPAQAHRVLSGLHGLPAICSRRGPSRRATSTRCNSRRRTSGKPIVHTTWTSRSTSIRILVGRSTAHGRVADTAPRRWYPRAPVHATTQGGLPRTRLPAAAPRRAAPHQLHGRPHASQGSARSPQSLTPRDTRTAGVLER